MEENISNDLAKEVITYLACGDQELIKKIPDYVIRELSEKAADSPCGYYIFENKPLMEQDMSEGCKDFLSLLYYAYMCDDEEKKTILDTWFNNKNI